MVMIMGRDLDLFSLHLAVTLQASIPTPLTTVAETITTNVRKHSFSLTPNSWP